MLLRDVKRRTVIIKPLFIPTQLVFISGTLDNGTSSLLPSGYQILQICPNFSNPIQRVQCFSLVVSEVGLVEYK